MSVVTATKVIAFLVGPKNERVVFNYIMAHREALSQFRLVLTDTETNTLESLLTVGLDVHYVPSLDKKGDVEISQRAAKNQVAAVFVLNPSAVSRQVTTDRFFALVEKCWTADCPLALNQSTIDLVMDNLIALQGICCISLL
jgi:methylglyoxal synthase